MVETLKKIGVEDPVKFFQDIPDLTDIQKKAIKEKIESDKTIDENFNKNFITKSVFNEKNEALKMEKEKS